MPGRRPGAIVGDRLAPGRPGPGVGEEPAAYETDRRLYLVECDLRDLSPAQRASVHRAWGEAVRREIQRGSQIRYGQRIYAPGEHRCLGLFEATDPQAVRSVNDIAQFPLARVVAAHHSVPSETGSLPDFGEDKPW